MFLLTAAVILLYIYFCGFITTIAFGTWMMLLYNRQERPIGDRLRSFREELPGILEWAYKWPLDYFGYK